MISYVYIRLYYYDPHGFTCYALNFTGLALRAALQFNPKKACGSTRLTESDLNRSPGDRRGTRCVP